MNFETVDIFFIKFVDNVYNLVDKSKKFDGNSIKPKKIALRAIFKSELCRISGDNSVYNF